MEVKMRIEKRVLNDALRVLGKVVCQTSPVELYRSIRFVGGHGVVRAMAADGVEVVSLGLSAKVFEPVDFCVEFRELRELVRIARNDVELSGTLIEFPELEAVPGDALETPLPDNFCDLVSQAAAVIDRSNYRQILQGVNLSTAGITATDGKQLLNLPCPLNLAESITLSFPLALLAAKLNEPGHLWTWKSGNNKMFKLEIGSFMWQGKALVGMYPEWKNIIPETNALDYHIKFTEPEQVLAWLKNIPPQKGSNGVEVIPADNAVTLKSCILPNNTINTVAEYSGALPQIGLTLDREVLLRMFLQGNSTLHAHSAGLLPILATGGDGRYVAMPMRVINQTKNVNSMPNKEEKTMENIQTVGSAPVQMVAHNPETELNPLDELGNSIEAFKLKLKVAFDDLAMLSRKVKEVQIQQRQKERDFIQAKRAIERIRMAI